MAPTDLADHSSLTGPVGRAELRVLHIVEASFAGVGRHTLDLVDGLDELCVRSHILYSPTRATKGFVDRLATSPASSNSCIMTRAPSTRQITAIRGAISAIRGRNIDVVHGHSTGGGFVARIAGRLTNTPVVFTPNAFYTLEPNVDRKAAFVYRSIERAIRPLTDALICVSPEELRHAHELRFAPNRSIVVQNGIEASATGSPADASVLARFQPGSNVRTIGFVGRFDNQKRPNLLIDAFHRLVSCADGDASNDSQMTNKQVQLVMVGNGDLAEGLKDQAQKLGIAERVVWLGEQDGPALMPYFDVLAVPSAYEGFPYVVLEALRAGTPVVAADQVPTESFGSDPCGLTTVDATDPNAFARGLEQSLNAAHNRENIMATQGPFTTESMAIRTLGVYQSVVGVSPMDDAVDQGHNLKVDTKASAQLPG